MRYFARAGWLALSLIVAATSCAAQSGACSFTLTSRQTQGSCALPAGLRARPPAVLELEVSKVNNPSNVAFSLTVYLEDGKDGPRELVGTVSIYPPDRPGVFALRPAPAFQRLRAAANVTVEMKPAQSNQSLNTVSVTLGSLRWLQAEP